MGTLSAALQDGACQAKDHANQLESAVILRSSGDEESRIALKILRARFFAALRMTGEGPQNGRRRGQNDMREVDGQYVSGRTLIRLSIYAWQIAPLSTNGRAGVSTCLKGNQIRRFGGSHSDEKVAFGHTNVPAGRTDEPLPRSKPDKFRPNINASNYPPAHPTGEAMLKHGERDGNRGSVCVLCRMISLTVT